MVAQDLTKFTVVIVLLGIVLAIAIFRPQILPSLAGEPNDEPVKVGEIDSRPDLGQGGEEFGLSQDILALQKELKERENQLDQRQVELDKRETELSQRQAALEEHEIKLDQHQAELDEREAALEESTASLQVWEERLTEQASLLDEKENEIAGQLAAIQAEQTRLAQWQEELQAERVRIDEERGLLRETEARLRRKEANLAELEQKIEGRLRLSVVAAVISGLLAVPSVLFFVALMRQGQRTPDKEVQQAQASRTRQRKRVTQYGRPVTVTPASTYSDNGRDKESIEALRVKGR